MEALRVSNNWCPGIEKDEKLFEQVMNAAEHPAIFRVPAIMPDAHLGYGVPIGSVIALDKAISPNMVGVDIGCGMGFKQLNIKVPSYKDLQDIRSEIVRKIPVGFNIHNEPKLRMKFSDVFREIAEGKDHWFTEKKWDRISKSLGTLGGGNHFIELQSNSEGNLCIMVHSGSRNLGFQIANYYHELAIEINEQYYVNLPHKDLAFLGIHSNEGKDYLREMDFALNFAKGNRCNIGADISECIEEVTGKKYLADKAYDVHHNYARLENHFGRNVWIHRKGAISATKGELGIVPGSMGSSSYITRGLGNIHSFTSSSHGAGRDMSRTDASLRLKEEDVVESMEGVIHGEWKAVRRGRAKGRIDFGEAPGAYKNIDDVMENQKDLTEIVDKLTPLVSVKG